MLQKPALLKAAALLSIAAFTGCRARLKEPLPSWNDGAAKQAIVQFVKKVTDRAGPSYVAPVERIAAFDNDGTLWVEQPLYVQVLFAADEMRALAARHPEWKANAAFQRVITGPPEAISELTQADQFAVAFAIHSGLTTDEYSADAGTWLASHRHPRFKRRYIDLAYQPMLELIALLRANQFQVYTVTGSEIGFVRVVNRESFGIPPANVIGTLLKNKFDPTPKHAQLLTLPELLLLDDSDGKPISINNVIGRRPIAAFGNSDGDLSMLQWTTSGPGARLAVLVHHDDAEREFAYDRNSAVGHLDKALNVAREQGWTVLSMKSDWKTMFADKKQ